MELERIPACTPSFSAPSLSDDSEGLRSVDTSREGPAAFEAVIPVSESTGSVSGQDS